MSSPIPSGGGPLVFVADVDQPVLVEADRHHLSRALRLRDGDPLVVSDGLGAWRAGRFRVAGEPELDGDRQLAARPGPAIEVAFALVKGSKPELAVQKLTELGIDRIRPFVAARSVVRWDAARSESALVRLRRVAGEASMQSRRAWRPEIDAVVSFAEVSADPRACRADRGGGPPSLDRPLILTGPEGGWDEAERQADLPTVGLAEGVLRAETAAITAGVLLAALRSSLVQASEQRR